MTSPDPTDQSMPPSEATDRFFEAFKRIEHQLRQRGREAGSDTSFKDLVGQASQWEYGEVGAYHQRLLAFKDLRNAIAHIPEDGDRRPIATPRDDVVREIEHVADTITSPPTVDSILGRDVFDVLGNELISKVAAKMKENDYSQAPVVYADNNFRTLLTTNTIARWFAESSENRTNREKACVDDVLEYREQEDEHEILRPDATLFDVLQIFEHPTEDEVPPYAIVVTNGGEESGRVEGILTAFDLPAIYSRLTPAS
jgi:predicted transcriptional regulator